MPASYDLTGKGKPNFARNPIYANNVESETYNNDDDISDVTNGSIVTPQNGSFTHPEKTDVIGGIDSSRSDSSSLSSKSSKSKDKKPAKPPMVGVGEVFKYASGQDRLLIVLGVLFACMHGAMRPITIIIFGDMTDSFISDGALEDHLMTYVPQWFQACLNMTIGQPGDPCQNITTEYVMENPASIFGICFNLGFPPGCEIINNTDPSQPIEGLFEQIAEYSVIFAIIGAVEVVLGYAQVMCWQTSALNQAQRIRVQLFRSILRQEIGWFDTHEVGELNTRMSDDVEKIEAGIGDKLGMFFNEASTFLAGIIIGFVYSWKLTLVILSASPLIILSGMAMGKVGSKMMSKELKAYAKAGAVAEEVLGAIRTVMAFGGEQKESTRYNVHLLAACKVGTTKGITQGMVTGLIMLVMFGSYALGFWYGSTLVFDDAISPGDLITVFFCVLIGTFSVGNAAPHVQDFSGSRGAAHAVFGIIEQEPHIDSSSKEGKQNIDITGNVRFSDVHFNYPSRPDVKVLNGLSLEIRVGQTVALVGSSGCGKSTTVQLLQRFYDPAEGQISMDDTDIREYNVKWLRQRIGVVSQEPVLFGTTIAENIRYGQDGINANDIIKACQEANAHDFISKLPKKYDTLVGDRGAQLSGGQKQRIAIARALVRNPKILLLDEATSALDTESEASVQAALDTARMGRTTLVIAHRLSTIRTADVIIGVKDGQVIEQGTHDELMSKKGLYHELVMNQQAHFEEEKLGNDTASDSNFPLKPGLERALSTTSSGKFQRGMSTLSVGSGPHKPSQITDETEVKLPDPGVSRILRMNAPEWPYIMLGCFSALIAGFMQPAFALVFSEILGIFAESGPEAQDRVNFFSGIFVVIGVVMGLSMFGTSAAFSRSGEALTMRLRELSFQALLKQEMAYFDDHSNNVGALCTRLATDASAVQGATGSRLGMFCQAMAGVLGGLVIGFVYSWELTLLIIAFGPFLLASGFIHMRLISGNRNSTKKSLETAGKVAIQAIENIRTVATLTKEQTFLEDYENETVKPFTSNKKKTHFQALAFGFSQAIMFWAQSAAFTLGAFLVENKGLAYEDMYRVFMAVVLGAVSAGRASSFAPDYGKAKASAAKIFQLLDRRSAIDGSDPTGLKPATCQGNIKMRDVSFNYPSRPDVPVLRGLDLDVTPGKRVALVGSSGCGKSTTIQLLQRFYDPHNGEVSVEGENIPDLNIQWLRSQMGIVSQEPILFDCSIRENIAYGDNSREVSMGEIIEAAKNANIHSFIVSLPQGYDTNVGDKGAQLSGGQKQRVAIARALVRNPKILLLDEATSALDTESEKVVQAALDRAQEGRTCIVIAHRLSTIQNADCIVVIHHGKVVEMGTHSELLQARGKYFKLNNAQLTKN